MSRISTAYIKEHEHATQFVSRLLNRERRVFSFLAVIWCILSFIVIWWAQELSSSNSTIVGFAYFFVLALILIGMPRLIRIYRKKMDTEIEPVYRQIFEPKVPLFVALASIRSDQPNNLMPMLSGTNSLFLSAYGLVDGNIKNDLFGYSGDTRGDSRVFSKVPFFDKLNDYFESTSPSTRLLRDAISALPSIIALAGLWALTGEFGHLRDWRFLRTVGSLPDDKYYSVIGRHGKLPARLDDVLDTISRQAAKDESSEDRWINSAKRDFIRDLVHRKKLVLFAYKGQLRGIHMAEIGSSLFIQQAHRHGQPSLFFLIKKPSKDLVEFARGYLSELMNSGKIFPVEI